MPVHVFTRKRRGLYTKMSKKNKHLKLIIQKQQQTVYPKKKKKKKKERERRRQKGRYVKRQCEIERGP